MEGLINVAIAIILLPLISFLCLVFLGKRLPRQGDFLSVGVMFVCLLLSLWIFIPVMQKGDPTLRLTQTFFWIDTGEIFGRHFVLTMGILLDNISAIMLVVVSLVSFLVQLFSVGYMHGDPKYSRYFAYLSLFSFAMLTLVLVDNLFALFMTWELVGLGSYLLIGFWYEKKAASQAATKAFLVTRVGDIGMFLGIMIVMNMVGDLRFDALFEAMHQGKFAGELWGIPLLTLAGVGLFMGAVGKSAQFPLHVWLPDAMEGPTPVSALIHAATMVAAGVYLVTRLFVFFDQATLLIIAYCGGFTALFAATIALVQTDIKKVLAYSTISQLGYMMLGLGVGAYSAGFLHLVTHAAFKACLFLCSGSVIHALHTQDIREMGGLRKKMPATFVIFLIATLALSGIPFFSGFLSKDRILAGVLHFALENKGHYLLAVFGFLGAALTAFYMFRLVFLTFLGQPRDGVKHKGAHEAPWTMLVPTLVLALLSFSVWFDGSIVGLKSWFDAIIEKPFLFSADGKSTLFMWGAPEEVSHTAHHLTLILSLCAAGFGILFAWLFFGVRFFNPDRWREKLKPIHQLLGNLYYVDQLYQWLIVQNLMRVNLVLANFDNQVIDNAIVDGSGRATISVAHRSGDMDNVVVDGTVDGIGASVTAAGLRVRRIQTGSVQQYLLFAVSVLILSIIIYVWL